MKHGETMKQEVETKIRLRENAWTKTQNSALESMALTPWADKTALLHAVIKQFPKVSPSLVLYHAVKHQALTFEYVNKMSKVSTLAAEALYNKGYDTRTIQATMQKDFGKYPSLGALNMIHFRLRRGSYVIKKNKAGKPILQHISQMITTMAKSGGISQKLATKRIINKIVMHHNSLSVTNNSPKSLLLTNANIQNKIKDINLATTMLGLDFGQLLPYINMRDLETLSSQTILTKLFTKAGLNINAAKLFPVLTSGQTSAIAKA